MWIHSDQILLHEVAKVRREVEVSNIESGKIQNSGQPSTAEQPPCFSTLQIYAISITFKLLVQIRRHLIPQHGEPPRPIYHEYNSKDRSIRNDRSLNSDSDPILRQSQLEIPLHEAVVVQSAHRITRFRRC